MKLNIQKFRRNNIKNETSNILEGKDSVKMQVNSWNIDELREKIYEINDIESLIKNNSKNSLNIVSDFIISY